MKKRDAIELVNDMADTILQPVLNNHNTAFSNVNFAEPIWWFEIDAHRFESDLHFLCAGASEIRRTNPTLIWLMVKGGTFTNPKEMFNYRRKLDRAILHIFCRQEGYLHERKSGHDFRPYVQWEWYLGDFAPS